MSGDASGLHHPFQDDDDLQVLMVVKVYGGDVVEGTVLVYYVVDNEWGDKEDAVAPHRVLHLYVYLVEGHHLPLQAGGLLHHLHADGGADDHTLPEVPYPQHEAELALTQGDDRVLTEDEGLSSAVGL